MATLLLLYKARDSYPFQVTGAPFTTPEYVPVIEGPDWDSTVTGKQNQMTRLTTRARELTPKGSVAIYSRLGEACVIIPEDQRLAVANGPSTAIVLWSDGKRLDVHHKAFVEFIGAGFGLFSDQAFGLSVIGADGNEISVASRHIAFSPRKSVADVSADLRTVRVWLSLSEMNQGNEPLVQISGKDDAQVDTLHWIGDQAIACNWKRGNNSNVAIYDAATGSVLRSFDDCDLVSRRDAVSAIVASRSTNITALCCPDQRSQRLSFMTFRMLRGDRITSATPDGAYVTLCREPNGVVGWPECDVWSSGPSPTKYGAIGDGDKFLFWRRSQDSSTVTDR
ncbi:MAG: hypothetical protein SFY96_05680 [Planctomycetota bacterium]|nr:hypothetical protein [Planctomycetota bacterium]